MILEELGVFVYCEEIIIVNYISNGLYSGFYGFVLEYYIGMLYCNFLVLFK